MLFSISIELGLSGVRGTESLDAVARHATESVPRRLQGMIDREVEAVHPDHVAGVVDYSCRLRASSEQEARGQATLTLALRLFVSKARAEEEAETDEEAGEDAGAERVESEAEAEELRTVAAAAASYVAAEGDFTGGSSAVVSSADVRVERVAGR